MSSDEGCFNTPNETMSDNHQTSEPGKATESLEPDFEKQLADEGFNLAGRETTPAAPLPEKKAEPEKPSKKDEAPADPDKEGDDEGKKPDADKKDDAPKNDDWRHAIARKRQEKQEQKDAELESLRRENEELKSGKKDVPSQKDVLPKKDEKADSPPPLTEEQKQLAAKYAIDEADFHKLFPTKVTEKVIEKHGLDEEQSKLLESLKGEREQLLIEKGFNTDFESNVLPLLKEEYPGISAEKIAEIKSEIFAKIQTDQFALTPLQILYRGEATFRGRVSPKKAGPDEGTKVAGKDGKKVWDFATVTEEDLKDPSFPFEQYSDWGEKNEKENKR